MLTVLPMSVVAKACVEAFASSTITAGHKFSGMEPFLKAEFDVLAHAFFTHSSAAAPQMSNSVLFAEVQDSVPPVHSRR